MKRCMGELTAGFRGNAGVFAAVVVLLFPSSASVLCIAPGGHLAVESINATCCAPSTSPASPMRQPDGGLKAPGDCQDCTDLFLTPNGSGAVLGSPDRMAASAPASECPGDCILTHRSLLLRSPDAPPAASARTPVSSAGPLRC